MLRGILRSTLYVRVQPNRFLLRHIESGRTSTVDAQTPFTTRRLLIGEYGPAVDALRRAMNEVRYGVPFFSAPTTIMHPLVMVEEGLSGVEYRILKEVAEGAGSKRAAIWVGQELSDEEVREKARAA